MMRPGEPGLRMANACGCVIVVAVYAVPYALQQGWKPINPPRR